MHVHTSLTAAPLCHTSVHTKNFKSSLSKKKCISNRNPGSGNCLVAHASAPAESSDPRGADHSGKFERARRLQSAVSNKNIKDFLEVIGEEWRYRSSSLPIHSFQLSKGFFQMLYAFMVKNNGMLVITPTEDDYGVDIGIRWVATFAKELPLAFGCNINTIQVYDGIVFLRNAKNIVDALIQMQLGQKLEEILLPLIDKLVPKGALEEKERIALIYSLLSVLIMVVSVIFLI